MFPRPQGAEVSFVGVGNMLTMLMRRGLLRSRDAAPVGSMEDSTVPVTEIEEDQDARLDACVELLLRNAPSV